MIPLFFYSRHLGLVLSPKAKFIFLPCCFVSGTRISFEFISDSSFSVKFGVSSLCPSSGFEIEILSSNVASKEFVRQMHFDTFWVTKGEMCVLEGFRLFKMCLHQG